jgi:hypothetical protein
MSEVEFFKIDFKKGWIVVARLSIKVSTLDCRGAGLLDETDTSSEP